MELKSWEEYSLEEKKSILSYWWNEFERRWPVYQDWANDSFNQVIDMDIDLVFAMVVMLFEARIESIGLFYMMSSGNMNLCVLLNKALEYRTINKKVGWYEGLCNIFLKVLVADMNEKYPLNKQNDEQNTGFGSM